VIRLDGRWIVLLALCAASCRRDSNGGAAGHDAVQQVPPLWEIQAPGCTGIEVLVEGARVELLVCSRGGRPSSGRRENRVAVFDAEGKETREFAVDAGVTQLRGVRDGSGQAVLAGFSNWGHSLFLYSGTGELLSQVSGGLFQGIDEVRAFDLDGDGRGEFLVGYNGGTGLKALRSDGGVLWHTKEIGNVWNLDGALLGTGASRRVLAVHAGGTIVVFGADGTRVEEWRPGEYCDDVFAADLDGDGRSEVAAIAKTGGVFWNRKESLLGLDEAGRTAWALELPGEEGSWRTRRHAAGDFLGLGKKQWAVACGGGSALVVDSGGKPLGSVRVSGEALDVAALPRPGGDLLLVATGSGVTAYDAERIRPRPSTQPSRPARKPEPTPKR
jgi:hypothetical protein